MSEKLTRIRIPGQRSGLGLMDWGEHSAEQMITQMRARSTHLKEQAAIIDATPDHGFQIDIIRGPHVQRHVREVQKASEACPQCNDLGFIPPPARMGETTDCPTCAPDLRALGEGEKA